MTSTMINTEATVSSRKGRKLPNRIPTSAVATAIVDYIRANADPKTRTITVSMSKMAEDMGLDFPRILRAKDQLVASGVLEQVQGRGKTYSYRLLKTEVPEGIVFRHKNTNSEPKTASKAAPTQKIAQSPQLEASMAKLNKRQLRSVNAAVGKFHEAYNHLFDTLENYGLVPKAVQ